MHQVERLLQICMATLATLGTLLLGMGERDMMLPVLALIVAGSSVYLTDIKGWLQLNTTVANLAGLVALAVSLRDLDRFQSEGQLLSMANLLIYLQFVLLFRKKNVRNYWLLALLSLLQVAVAAALNLSIGFGLLLMVYLFVGLATLSLFFLYREQVRLSEEDRPLQATLSEPPAPDRPPARWPLSAVPSGFTPGREAATASNGVGWGLFGQVAKLGLTTLALTGLMFFTLPRLGRSSPWRPRGGGSYRVVGFTQSVTLGELGEAFQNPEQVMQVELTDYETNEVYRVSAPPLFRGALLHEYHAGRWRRRRGPSLAVPMPVQTALPLNAQLVRQSITIEALEEEALFCIVPSFKSASNPDLLYASHGDQIVRRESQVDRQFKYEMVTAGLRDHFPVDIWPATADDTVRRASEYDYLLKMPDPRNGIDPLEGLRTIGQDLVRDLPASRIVRAQAIVSWLRDSGAFRYSLQPIKRVRTLDPIEDFVTRSHAGHCEYFASALTLMLRSVNIPARLAVGFKGGEWNAPGEFLQVRQLHAHSWVEVYLGEQDLPERLRGIPEAVENGAWWTLDPTPGSGDPEMLDAGYGTFAFRQMTDFSHFLWSNYVLGMDSQRQQESIYQPVVKNVEEALRKLADPDARREIWKELRALIESGRQGWDRGDWFSWRGVLLLLVGGALLLATYLAGALTWRLVVQRRRRRRVATRRRIPIPVEFYRRLEAMLAGFGLTRPANQTQREFAIALGGQLADSPATRHVAGVPRRVADAFYRVRFGRLDLDNVEAQAVEQAISDLAAAMASSRRPRSGSRG